MALPGLGMRSALGLDRGRRLGLGLWLRLRLRLGLWLRLPLRLQLRLRLLLYGQGLRATGYGLTGTQLRANRDTAAGYNLCLRAMG